MKTNTTTNEKELNTVIYLQLADIAREVFNNIVCEPGVYTPADIARAVTGGPVVIERNRTTYELQRVEKYAFNGVFSWAENYDPATVYEVAAGSFSCRVNAWKIWGVLDRAGRSWGVPTGCRVSFVKSDRPAAPVVVTLTISKTDARDLLACLSDDKLRPVMNHVHLDVKRRVLVASDGHVLRAVRVAADDITTTSEAAAFYNLPASVLKTTRRHVTVKIDAEGVATADEKAETAAPCCPDMYPNWAAVLQCPEYSEAGRVELTAETWRELKKTIADVSKTNAADKYRPSRVTLAHLPGENVLHVYARDLDFSRERDAVVTIDTTAPAFSIDIDARRVEKLATPAALYLADASRALYFIDAVGVSLVMPILAVDDAKYYAPFTIEPQGATLEPLPGIDLKETAHDITTARHLNAAVSLLKENETAETPATADELAETLAHTIYCKIEQAAEILNTARELLAAAGELTAHEPQADTIESETPAETITTTSEAENVAENVENVPAPAADPLTPAETVSEAENERETPQADTTTAAPAADDIESEAAPVLFTTADGETFRRGDRVIMTCLYYADRREVVGTLTDKERGGSTAEVTDDEGRKFYGWYAGVKHATADTLTAAPADDIESEPQAEHLTPADVLTAYNENERAAHEREKAETIARADVETLAATWPGLTRAEILADLLTITTDRAAELLADIDTPQPDPVAWLTDTTAENVSGSDAPAETITTAPAADTIETPDPVSETPANVWALADELPTADGLTADTVTPADLLTIESERAARPVFVAVSVENVADPADTPQADREAVSEAENERESRRALLLTIASRARRLAVAVAAVVVAALLLTITPDRPTTGTAAPAADLLAPVAVADTIESETPDTLTREALTLTADTVAPVFEPVSVAEVAAPADTRPTVRERHHAPRIKREIRRPDLLAVELAPDTVSETPDTLAALLLTIESADTLTAAAPADTLQADTLAPAGRELLADSLTIESADTLTAAPADTITTARPAAGTREAVESERESEADPVADVITTTADPDPLTIESETPDPDPVSEADGDPQADPLTPSPAGTTGTPSPLTLTPSTVAPVTPSPAGTFSASFLML